MRAQLRAAAAVWSLTRCEGEGCVGQSQGGEGCGSTRAPCPARPWASPLSENLCRRRPCVHTLPPACTLSRCGLRAAVPCRSWLPRSDGAAGGGERPRGAWAGRKAGRDAGTPGPRVRPVHVNRPHGGGQPAPIGCGFVDGAVAAPPVMGGREGQCDANHREQESIERTLKKPSQQLKSGGRNQTPIPILLFSHGSIIVPFLQSQPREDRATLWQIGCSAAYGDALCWQGPPSQMTLPDQATPGPHSSPWREAIGPQRRLNDPCAGAPGKGGNHRSC